MFKIYFICVIVIFHFLNNFAVGLYCSTNRMCGIGGSCEHSRCNCLPSYCAFFADKEEIQYNYCFRLHDRCEAEPTPERCPHYFQHKSLQYNTKCANGQECVPLFSGYYCKCDSYWRGYDCRLRNLAKIKRVQPQSIAIRVKDEVLAQRLFMICHEPPDVDIPDFKGIIRILFPNWGGTVEKYINKGDFKVIDNPLSDCLANKLDGCVMDRQLIYVMPANKSVCHYFIFKLPYNFIQSYKDDYHKDWFTVYYEFVVGDTIELSFGTNIGVYSDDLVYQNLCNIELHFLDTVYGNKYPGSYVPEVYSFLIRVRIVEHPIYCENFHFISCSGNMTWYKTDHTLRALHEGDTTSRTEIPIPEGIPIMNGTSLLDAVNHLVYSDTHTWKINNEKDVTKRDNFNMSFIRITVAEPTAVISGGTYRLINTTEKLTLNGSDSYDLLDNTLAYYWSCNIVDDKNCSEAKGDKTYSPTVPFKSGKSIVFTLKVESLRTDKRSASHSTDITIAADENVTVPEVPIMCFCNCPGSYGLPNPDEYSCFRAAVKEESNESDIYNWKLLVKGKPFDLSKVKIMSSRKNDLIINTKALVAQTASYTFEIIAQDTKNQTEDPKYRVTTKFEFNVEKLPEGYVNLFKAEKNYHVIVTVQSFGNFKYPIIYEYYFVSEYEDQPDVFFFYCNWPRIFDIIPISRVIRARYCTMRGSCGMKKSHPFNIVPFTPLRLKEIVGRTHYYMNKTCPGYVSDAFIHIIAMCEKILEIEKDMHKEMNQMLAYIMKVELHFFRDISQVLSIFVHCIIKKNDIYKDPRSEQNSIDIISLADITNFLVKIAEKLESDIKTAYPAQPDHSLNDYVNFILRPFFTVLDIIIENKYILLRKPETKKNIKGIEKLFLVSENLKNIFGKLNKIFGRKLVPGSMEPIVTKTKHLFFHAQKDFPKVFENSTTPSIKNDPYLFQVTKSDVRMIIPIVNKTIANSENNHVISIIAFAKDPFRWNPFGRIMDSLVIYVFFAKEEINKYKYNLTMYKGLVQNIHLRFKVIQTHSIVKSVLEPPRRKSPRELDNSINVFTFDCKTAIFDVEIYRIPEYEHVRLIFQINKFPDYKMYEDFKKVNAETSFMININVTDTTSICYLGVLPGSMYSRRQYEMTITKVKCYIWAEAHSWKLDVQLCKVSTLEKKFVCTCNHLSAFAAGITPVRATRRRIVENHQSLTECENLLATLILLLIILLFTILGIIAWRRDKKDILLDRAIFLEDNYPGYRHPYLIGVFTGNRIGAGTTATIGFQLFGEKGESKSHILKCTYRRVLTRGSDDWFIIYTPKCLGCVDYLYVWSDFHGKCPSWFCHKFIVIDLYEKQEFDFFIDKWFTVYLREMALLTHEVSVTDPTKAEHKNYLTTSNYDITLKENHAFAGVMSRHPRSNLTRLQRVEVMLFTIFNILTIQLFILKMIDRKKVDDTYFMFLRMRDFYVAIISFFPSIVLTFLLCHIFKKATSAPYYPQEYDSKTNTIILVPRACEDLKNYRSRSIVSLLMFQPLKPIIVTPDQKYKYQTKKGFLIIGWLILIVVVLVEFIVDSIRSYTYPELKSFKWIVFSILTFFIQFFIFETVFHAFISIILGYVFKISQKVTTVLIHNPLSVHSYFDPKLTNADWWIRLHNIRSQSCYEPLGVKKEYFIRRVMYNNWAQKWTVIDLTLVTIYLILFSLFLRSFCILECNLASNHINKLFNFESEEVLHEAQFSRIYTAEELMNFFQQSILAKLYTKFDYRGNLLDPQENDKTGYLDGSYVYKLLGVPRIRQKRVLSGTCLFPPTMNVSEGLGNLVCNDQLENSEDTQSYSPGWKILTPDIVDKAKNQKEYENWFYFTAAETNTIGMFGKSGKHYDGGGYIALLSNIQEESTVKINQLRSDEWIDELTRVIFFEFVLYNVNTNTFSAVVFISENFATGTYITKIEIRSLIFHLYNMSLWGVSAFFLIIILLIIFIGRTMYLLQLYGLKNFFRKVSNVLSLIACFLGSTAVLLTLLHLKLDIFSNEALRNKLFTPVFFNLYKQMVREYFVTVLIALFTSTVFIRLIFFWFLYPTFDVLRQTAHYIIGIILTILVIFFCFCLILHHYIPNLIQNPAFQSYSSALTNNYSLRQLTKNLMRPENIILQVALCIIAAVSFFLTRLLIMFYYTVASYNRTTNLFHVVNKRSLASVIFDEKYKKALLFDPAAHDRQGGPPGHGGLSFRKGGGVSGDPRFRKGANLDEQRIRKMRLITIETLLDDRDKKS